MMGAHVLHRLLGRLLPKLRGTTYVTDKTAYRDILLASGFTYLDWAKGNPEARIGSQLGTNRTVYDRALKMMLVGIEKNWPKYLPAFKASKPKKTKVKAKKSQKKSQQLKQLKHVILHEGKEIDITPKAKAAKAGSKRSARK
jgi:hypothetical protein